MTATETTTDPTRTADLLDRILAPSPPPFALLHRPDSTGTGRVDVLVGDITEVASLADIPIQEDNPPAADSGERHEVLAMVPFRQIAERGFACVDDGAPLLALTVSDQATTTVPEVCDRIPETRLELTDARFDIADDDYADLVRTVITDEIGQGEGSNFVVKRSFTARIGGYSVAGALSLFAQLLSQESGAYWTFIVHTESHTFVGASPERHVTLAHDTVTMNPISGTYRYPPAGPELAELLDFLADRKETDELYMVVDEELKMMARICAQGGRVVGPHLKEMARLAHTEYFIEGRSTLDVPDILRATMFAPTVTGSPLENACRVIKRSEPAGRGYYSGVVALVGRDEHGGRTLDSAILIRTADIDRTGTVRIGVGATLVRHSDPESEVAETHAKAAVLLAALGVDRPVPLAEHPRVQAVLAERNTGIADFWLTEPHRRTAPVTELAGRSVLVVDAEDTFTAMIDHQLRAMGMRVTVRRYDEVDERRCLDGHDLVVMGPGPGDPTNVDEPKIARLRAVLGALLAARRPFLAVCLSHQLLSGLLGLDLVRRPSPNQGVQREIDLFGTRRRVGFYNTFAARCDSDAIEPADPAGVGHVDVCRDPVTGEVHALRGSAFASLQFHAESLLTESGPHIVGGLLAELRQ